MPIPPAPRFFNVSRRRWFARFLLLPAVAGAPALARTDLSRFPLSRAIPDDAFVAVCARHNPERKFLEEYWARVGRAFSESGIVEDVWDLITDNLDDEQLDKIESITDELSDAFGKVEWGSLFEREMVHVGRFFSFQRGMSYEGIVICRLDAKGAPSTYKQLKEILETVTRLINTHSDREVVTVSEAKQDGATVASLTPGELPVVGARVAVAGDVIAISLGGTSLMDDCLALLSGKSKKKRLVETERFREAFEKLPPAEDSLVMLDLGRMFARMSDTMKAAERAVRARAERRKADEALGDSPDQGDDEVAKAEAEDDESDEDDGDDDAPARRPAGLRRGRRGDPDAEDAHAAAMLAFFTRVIDDISIFEYVAEVEWTDGYRTFTDSYTVLRPGSRSKPLYRILNVDVEMKNFERFIPKEADDFACGSGLNWSGLYGYVRKLIGDHGPDGEEVLEKLDDALDEIDLDLDKNLLAPISSGYVSIRLGSQWALFFPIDDEENVRDRIAALFDRLRDHLGEESGLLLTPVEIAGKAGFTQVSHPFMMMMGGFSPPVWGCAEGHLILGSSTRVVEKCLNTAAGKHANILKNPRFLKEGLTPEKGTLCCINFTDERNFATELQAAVGGFAMATGMISLLGQGAPPEFQKVVSKISPIVAKLGPVVAKLDFYQSSAGYTTRLSDGWYTRYVQNYKEPRPREAQPEAAGDDAEREADDADRPPGREERGNRRSGRPPPKEPDQESDDDE